MLIPQDFFVAFSGDSFTVAEFVKVGPHNVPLFNLRFGERDSENEPLNMPAPTGLVMTDGTQIRTREDVFRFFDYADHVFCIPADSAMPIYPDRD